jgi:hypothetical protein
MITIGFSTRKTNPEFVDYVKNTCQIKNVEVIEKVNNGEKSLSEVYNEILKESKNDIVILCHDDIEFDTKGWGKKILKHFQNSDFGILGVAGTTEMPESGMWWEDRRKMLGIVNHKDQGKKWESKYSKSWGDEITQCCLVDGLFIAINKTKIKKNFDESVKGFHFYDVYFSTNNFLSDVKIGVIYNVRITHKSVGKTNETWEENKLIYKEKYKSDLPLKSKINLNYNLKEFKFLKKYKIKIIINSGENIEWVDEVLKKIDSFNLPNYSVNLISHEKISDDIKKYESETIKIYDGFFDELSKNLSILKWEDNFVSEVDDLIFFIDKNVKLINNIFSSICRIHHTERPNFGCAFPSSLYDDLSIFSTKIDYVRNTDNNINIILNDNNSYYNVMSGYMEKNTANFSDVFVTTFTNLKNNDWFDIQYDTNTCFNDFSLKCFLNNKKTYVDTDSLTTQTSFLDSEKINQDINKLLAKIVENKKSEILISEIRG